MTYHPNDLRDQRAHQRSEGQEPMSTEEDREALSKLIQDRSILWRFQADGLADVILAAGFRRCGDAEASEMSHRTPAPAPDVQALIAEARRGAGKWGPGPTATGLLLHRLADALEASEKELAMRRSESADFERERDEAVAALEAAFGENQ